MAWKWKYPPKFYRRKRNWFGNQQIIYTTNIRTNVLVTLRLRRYSVESSSVAILWLIESFPLVELSPAITSFLDSIDTLLDILNTSVGLCSFRRLACVSCWYSSIQIRRKQNIMIIQHGIKKSQKNTKTPVTSGNVWLRNTYRSLILGRFNFLICTRLTRFCPVPSWHHLLFWIGFYCCVLFI